MRSINLLVYLFMKKVYRILLFILVILTNSCYQDVVDMDLADIEPRIVIEGSILDVPGPYVVKISKTSSFPNQNNIPPVTDATVTIFDDFGNYEILTELPNGIYQTRTFRGYPDRSYTLRVLTEDKEYTAVSHMPTALEISSMWVERDSSEYDKFKLMCSFWDRPNIPDYSKISVYIGYDLIEEYLYNGILRDGQEIILELVSFDSGFNSVFTVDMLTIDNQVYDFFDSFDALLEIDDGDNDDATPIFLPITLFNPTSNFSGGALGCFSAHTLRRYYYSVN